MGALFIFLAFLHLPIIILSPQKFLGFFTMGYASIITGLITLRGPKVFLKGMIEKNRLFISVVYTLSILMSFYYSIIDKNTKITAIKNICSKIEKLKNVCITTSINALKIKRIKLILG